MPLNHSFETVRIASFLVLALAFTAPASSAVPAAANHDEHPIRVTAVAGDVDVSMADVDVQPRVGEEVLLPARIVTGADGTIALEQSRTSISIAPDSDVEIPQAAIDGQLIARLVQWRGNVFYDVETRKVERLTVETPYLVAVVKGTQFNVAVLDGTTTISLFEGRLEIRDPDGRNVIDLEAGEVAIRSSGDPTIRVIDMRVAELPTLDRNGALVAEVARTNPSLLAVTDGRGVETALGTIALDAGLGGATDLGPAGADLSMDATLATGALDLGLDASADLGSASLATDLSAGLDLGGATVDLGLDAGASLPDLELDASADLGVAGSLADGSLDASLGTDVGVGDIGIGAGLDTSLDVGDGAIAGQFDVGADLGGTGLDAGLDAGVDLGGGDASAGLELGGLVDAEVGAGLDLGGDDAGVGAGVTLPGGIDASLDVDLGDGSGESGGGLLDIVDVDGDSGLLGGLL